MLCHAYRVGRVDYAEAWRMQREFCRQRLNGDIPDVLLLVEHPPTITVGKSGSLDNILVPMGDLERRSVSLFFTDRGGDVTCHVPGQLVIYPIVDLRQRGRDVHAYVRDLEEVVIRTLGHFDIYGGRNNHAGVWVNGKQISAIGIAIKRWITMHGVALNVRPCLDDFTLINPCGLAGVPVTSIFDVNGQAVSLSQVADVVIREFAAVFGAVVEEAAELGAKV